MKSNNGNTASQFVLQPKILINFEIGTTRASTIRKQLADLDYRTIMDYLFVESKELGEGALQGMNAKTKKLEEERMF